MSRYAITRRLSWAPRLVDGSSYLVRESPDFVGRDYHNASALSQFPSLKARRLLRVLTRGLGYEVVRQTGSHRRMEAVGRPPITFSFHDRQTIRPATEKKILCNQVGLSEDEALRLL